MSLSVTSRTVGSVAIFECSGRITEGASTAALHQRVSDALPISPHFVLHLGGVDFIDSSGVGLLVRMLNQTRNAGGDLKLCALSPKVAEVLRVTRLAPIFDRHDTDADAITAFYDRPSVAAAASGRGATSRGATRFTRRALDHCVEGAALNVSQPAGRI